jgi:tRNA pseudouridine55 synthase
MQLLNLNKPQGITSQEAVTKVKRLLKIKKAGHTGTLDPIATGVLVICLDEATKLAGYLIDLDKEYVITMKLGERTDTFDAEGKVIGKVEDFNVTEDMVREVLDKFRGRQIQKVPPYSAVKRGGIPLYKLARSGMEVERPSREVNIYSIELMEFQKEVLKIKVRCSKGTYVRTLIDDIGLRLGTFAHITGLVRTAVGPFRIEESFSLEDLKEGRFNLIPVDEGLSVYPEIRLKGSEARALKNGSFIPVPLTLKFNEGTILRLYDESGFFGMAIVRGGRLKPERIVRTV